MDSDKPQSQTDQDLAEWVLRRYERLKSYRANFETQWHEIALRILPRADDFTTKRSPGTKREDYIYDSTAVLALPAFASAMESMLTPRNSKWHMLRPHDLDLIGDEETELYCERVRDLMFRVRYSAYANFASQTYETYMGLGAFGTGAVFVQDALSKGIRYQCIPLSEMFVDEDAAGVVDTVIRRYELSARQAYQKFGDLCPADICNCVDKEPDRTFEFLHAVFPNEERKVNLRNFKGMAFRAVDVSVTGKRVLREGGYRTMPYAVSRYVTAPREVYGRSPAWDVLADVKTLNEMSKTTLRYGQLVTDPPWITADVDSLEPFKMRPGAINPGYMNEQGMVLAKALAPDGDPRITLEMANQRRESINRAFLITLFQILVDTPQMSATEAMLRAQEKGALLAPTMGRQQSELLGPIIARELDILQAAGALPEMPPAMRDRGGRVKVEYDSPLTRAQRAEEGVGILRTLEAITPLANIDPQMLKAINATRTLKRLREINGAPADMLNSDAEMAAMQEAEAQQQALAGLVQAAPAVSQTVKNLAQANKEATAAPF